MGLNTIQTYKYYFKWYLIMMDFIELPKKCTKKEIKNFENQSLIKLPEQYENFLLEVGAGEIKYKDNEYYYIYQDKNNNKYELNNIIMLFNLLEENELWGNYEPFKSGLLIFAQLYNNLFYCICIEKNSINYGNIYYIESGYHSSFDYLIENQGFYKELPLLENNFDDFINNIKKIPFEN